MNNPHYPPFNTVHLEAFWPFGQGAWTSEALLIGAGQVPTWRAEIQRGDDEPYENVVPLAPNGASMDAMRLVMN